MSRLVRYKGQLYKRVDADENTARKVESIIEKYAHQAVAHVKLRGYTANVEKEQKGNGVAFYINVRSDSGSRASDKLQSSTKEKYAEAVSSIVSQLKGMAFIKPFIINSKVETYSTSGGFKIHLITLRYDVGKSVGGENLHDPDSPYGSKANYKELQFIHSSYSSALDAVYNICSTLAKDFGLTRRVNLPQVLGIIANISPSLAKDLQFLTQMQHKIDEVFHRVSEARDEVRSLSHGDVTMSAVRATTSKLKNI